VTRRLQLPQLWTNTKYVAWHTDHLNPLVRVPRPGQRPESKTIQRLDGESEYDLYERCLAYRDQRGVEIWGKVAWETFLKVPARSVARQTEPSAGPVLGVRHYTRGELGVWVVCWHERQPDGTRRQRSRHLSYGTPNARHATSDEALAEAIEIRTGKEQEWYSTPSTGRRSQA
jgi:hypothetical protein